MHLWARVSVWLLAASASLPLAFLFSPAARAEPPGPEVCQGCHEATVKAFLATKHGTKADQRTPINHGGCTVCHRGDTEAHVKAGGGKGVGGMLSLAAKSIPSEEKNGICLGCHQGDAQRIHWKDSVHANRDLACTSCHQIHTLHDNVRDKLTQPYVCFNCHKDKRAQVNKPSHHPVLEGKVSCSDCHNVHGDNPSQLVRGSVNETCYQCHMEKRGPFVHNHQPVTEDCTICHQPHGTTIASLLKSRPPFLCQDCHASTGGPTNHAMQPAGLPTGRFNSGGGNAINLGTVGRGCLNCHTEIHGSNSTLNSATTSRFRR